MNAAHAPGDGGGALPLHPLRIRTRVSLQPRGQAESADLTSAAFSLDVDVSLPGRGFTAVFGPSGCGKTTLLRAVAGLVRSDAASPGAPAAPCCVHVAGQTWQDDASGCWLPTHRRPLGYVFQHANLLPHLNVTGNLRFGQQRVPASQRRVSLQQAIELLGIAPLLGRKPSQLSGGERQRVAIARAVATSPALLLMDEPLAALDATRKNELLPWFERLQRELDIPVLYVTHSTDEVARLAEHVLLLEHGRVLAHGPASEMFTRPDLPLASSEAASAIVCASVLAHDRDWNLLQLQFNGGTLQMAAPQSETGAPALGQPVRLRVQARDISLTLERPAHTSILNVLPVRVQALRDDGHAQVWVTLAAGNAENPAPPTLLLAQVTRKSAHALGLTVGQAVFAQIKSVALLG